jgi:8-amino-7-oxononanoate synthase
MDILAKCATYPVADELRATGNYPYFVPVEGQAGATFRLGDREVVNCGSNNYLGLATDQRVRAAAVGAVERYGTSTTGSRLLNGNLTIHGELEAELADFFGKPAALVFTTGQQANLGVLAGLLTRSDTVVLDAAAHASLIDGARLSGARLRRFPHNDAEALERMLRRAPAGLVVVDGVYSMEGDVCALPAIQAVCARFGARLLVDDAHGAGVLGRGRGTCAQFGLTDQVDLISVTFSKSFASIGGAVLGDPKVIDYLRHTARSLLFTAGGAPASVAAALAALRIARAEPWRGQRALRNAGRARDLLVEAGFRIGRSATPVVGIQTGGMPETLELWSRTLAHGAYTNAILPPAASPRLRVSFTAAHTDDHLVRLVAALRAARAEVGATAAA